MTGEPPFVTLMFHAVLAPGDEIPAGREDGAALYDLPLGAFEAQMGALAAARVAVLSPGAETTAARGPAVTLTFDDGEESSHTRVLPVLQRHGFPGFFFVTPARVGTPGYMSWDQIRELARAGMQIGAHGLTHRVLLGLSGDGLRDELHGARAAIEEAIGAPVDVMSVPRGFYDQAVIDAAVGYGYRRIYVSAAAPGVRGPIFPRTAVKRDWSAARLLQAANGITPGTERVFDRLKEATKSLLGPDVYDRFRSAVLQARG